MKKLFIAFALMSAFAVNASAQGKFTFTFYGDIPTAKLAFEEDYFLKDVSPKWNTFIYNYTHTNELEVGMAKSATEIRKPAIYNAVQRVSKFVKRGVKNSLISTDDAVNLMNYILDCANIISYEEDTLDFEQAARKVKTGEEAIALFKNVEIARL